MQQTPNTLAEHVLSKNIFGGFGEFVTDVLRKSIELRRIYKTRPVFIAVITRRCFVLFFAYYQMLCWYIKNPDAERPSFWKKYLVEELEEFAEVFRNCVITDNAAWSMAYDVVKAYCEKQKEGDTVPFLIAVDELLFHGRALNGFLYGLEKRLLHAKSLFEKECAEKVSDEQFIEKIFLQNLIIRVANRNIGSSVLLPRYKENLNKNNPNIDLDIESWRNRSIAYAQYVSICGINNTGFTLGVAIPSCRDQILSKYTKSLFTRVRTQLQDIEQDTWIYFYPSIEQPRMVCTVRCKQSQTDEKKNLYVPFLILDHIMPEQLFNLHQQLLQEAHTDGMEKVASMLERMDNIFSAEENSQKEFLIPWFAQTTDLVLTFWLMKRFLREVKGVSQEEIADVWKDSVDWEPLVSNFRSYNVNDPIQKETFNALQQLWSWEPSKPLEEYFKVYTANAKPLSVDWMDLHPLDGNIVMGENSPLVQCIEDTISKIGFEAERNAYTLYGSGLSFLDEALSSWGDNHSLDTVLEKLHTQTQFYDAVLNRVNIYEVLAVITQAMDLGLLGMNTIFDKQPCADRIRYESNPRELYSRQRAGEASLFLMPIRYRNFLSVLSEIQDKRKEDFEGAAFDLNRFIDSLAADYSAQDIQITNDIFMPAEQLKRSLYSAYEMLVQGGQKIKEWQCGLYDRRLSFEEQEKVSEINRSLKTRFLWTYRNL